MDGGFKGAIDGGDRLSFAWQAVGVHRALDDERRETGWLRAKAAMCRSTELQATVSTASVMSREPCGAPARRLQLPVSNETLLRVVRRRGTPTFASPQAIGIDD